MSSDAWTPSRLWDMYTAGNTVAELRQRTGLSARQITKRIRAGGHVLRPAGHMKGKPHPEHVRAALRRPKTKKKGPLSAAHREALCRARTGRKPALGMRHSAEARAKMSATRRGPGNGRWIDGRKQTPYPSEWTPTLRAMIRERDRRQCVDCGTRDGLQVHHNDEDKQNCDPLNLITVCAKCHGKRHRRKAFGPYILKSCGKHSVLHHWALILRPEMLSVGDHVRVDSFTKIESGLGMTFGAYVHIASFAHVGIGGGQLVAGDHAMIASGAKILTGTNLQEGRSMSSAAPAEDQKVARLRTVLGAGCFIGAGAIVLPGRVIGEGAVIGAGAVVTKDVPPGEVWAGNPARKIGMRRGWKGTL